MVVAAVVSATSPVERTAAAADERTPSSPDKQNATGQTATITRLDGSEVAVADIERAIDNVMEKAGVPGLSCAIINGGKIVYAGGFGVRERGKSDPVDEQTIFGAASFSKTIFAYLVLGLVEDGVIDLDKPLCDYLPKPLPDYPAYADLADDDRYKEITARIVLSHTTGFPNWRVFTEDGKLRFVSTPGERFGYSGEGIDLLQMVVEEITGKGLEELARVHVFMPLGMTRTSYVWDDQFDGNLAIPHDAYERPKQFRKRKEADAAGSMVTTARDYARLLCVILNGMGLKKAAIEEMVRPQIVIQSGSMFGSSARTDDSDRHDGKLAWGLGWGRFDCDRGRAMFHTGHEGGTQNYNVTFVDKGIGVVFLSNSDNFESVARELADVTIGDVYSPFDWLGYPQYDPNRFRVPPPEPVVIEVDSAILESYVGTYELGGGKSVSVKFENGGSSSRAKASGSSL
jgi:CubicO group peptidase (beta-lactamase class C family)